MGKSKQKPTYSRKEEQKAHKVIIGILIGLIALALLMVLVY